MRVLFKAILVVVLLSITNIYSYSQPSTKQTSFIYKKKKKVVDPIDTKTKNCELYDGLFRFYQDKKDGSSFIEIDTSHIGKE